MGRVHIVSRVDPRGMINQLPDLRLHRLMYHAVCIEHTRYTLGELSHSFVLYRLSQRLFHKCVAAPTPPDISARFPGHSRVLFCFRIDAYAS